MGLQLTARPFDEATLLRAADAFERRAPMPRLLSPERRVDEALRHGGCRFALTIIQTTAPTRDEGQQRQRQHQADRERRDRPTTNRIGPTISITRPMTSHLIRSSGRSTSLIASFTVEREQR